MKLLITARRWSAVGEVIAHLVAFTVAAYIASQLPVVMNVHPLAPVATGIVTAGARTMTLNFSQNRDLYGKVAARPACFVWRATVILATSATLLIALGMFASWWLKPSFEATNVPPGLATVIVTAACLYFFSTDVTALLTIWDSRPAARKDPASMVWARIPEDESARMAEAATTIAHQRKI